MKPNHTKCLVLNADYTPITIITWKRAVIWSMKNNRCGIEIIDFYKNDCIRGVSKTFPLPAVARTKRYFKQNLENIVLSRKNIFVRDNYTCQYCGKILDYGKLTYDHVIPRSQSGLTTWTNIVSACMPCNSKKGNRTPKEANMPLLKTPTKPEKRLRHLHIYEYISTIKHLPDEWKLYLSDF